MAEVIIGVVSGALTFATVAAQVTKSIIEIKDCWRQIRDAPEDLQSLVRRLDLCEEILIGIEAHLSQNSFADALKSNGHASQSLKLCKEAVNDLETVSRNLMEDIRDAKGFKRAYVSFKAVAKKGNIEKYKARLESAMSLLSLSQQFYLSALFQVQSEFMVNKILGSRENAAGQQMSQNKESDDVNSIAKPSYRPRTRHTQREKYLWRLVLPSWLVGKCFEVARSGWQWNFKTYNILPYKSQVFQLVESNNIEGLQRLFSSGQASPFDSTPTGKTLILQACDRNSVEMVEFLISQGADVEGWSGRIQRWFGCFAFLYDGYGRDRSRLPLLHALQGHHDELYAMEDDIALESLKCAHHCSVEEYGFLQRNICPSFYEAPQWKRNSVLETYINRTLLRDFIPGDSYAIICTILRGVSFTACPSEFESYSKFLASYGLQNFPRTIAKHIGNYFRLKRLAHSFDEFTNNLWSFHSILNDFLVGGFDINEVDHAESHLLIGFFYGYLNNFSAKLSGRSLNDGFRWWLKELQNIGVNLKSFGKSGERSFKLSGGPREYACEHFYLYVSHRFLGFSHGNSPEDWNLWVSEPSDSFSGDFWRMVERRMEIPGGWSSDIHLFLQ